MSLLGGKIPIAGAAGDQRRRCLDSAVLCRGSEKYLWNRLLLLMNTGEKAVNSQNGLLTTIATSFENKIQYALEGSIFVGGMVCSGRVMRWSY